MPTEKDKGGRPPKRPGDKYLRVTVTLPPDLALAIEMLRRENETFSEVLRRILYSHPMFALKQDE